MIRADRLLRPGARPHPDSAATPRYVTQLRGDDAITRQPRIAQHGGLAPACP